VAIGDSHTDPTSGYTLPWLVWLRRVGRTGFKTVNLGVSGDTTADMRERIGQAVSEGTPHRAVLFGGGNDAVRGVDPAETERNVGYMVDWLREHGVDDVVVIGPGVVNWEWAPDWAPAVEHVRAVLGDVAARRGATFVDLARFLRDRIELGKDPDFSRVPYRQSQSWHVRAGDPHFNAYGQRLIAEAFLASTR
jgi:lysophospholipase L1-like esterase